MADVTHLSRGGYVALDRNGRPAKHWSGRNEAVKVLRQFVNTYQPSHLSQDEATDVVENMLRAYLNEL